MKTSVYGTSDWKGRGTAPDADDLDGNGIGQDSTLRRTVRSASREYLSERTRKRKRASGTGNRMERGPVGGAWERRARR